MSFLSNTDAKQEHEGMVVYDKSELDAAFADMEFLLDEQRPTSRLIPGNCVGCGANNFVYNGPCHGIPGSSICVNCGAVVAGNVYYETMYGNNVPTKCSNYKRIHHWHERVSQLLLHESQIPNEEMLQIGELLCSGVYDTLNKDIIRSVLRSLNKQLYIEKWLQIIQRVTGITPPLPGAVLIKQLDELFLELQRPFDAYCMEGRKNFLNYNYVFCRLFQKLGCEEFCMFFPLIKSKTKLRVLDEMWMHMCRSINWEFKPLIHVAPFAVQLAQPDVLLKSLRHRLETQVQVVTEKVPLRMEYQRWGHYRLKHPPKALKQRRSVPFEPEFQRLGLLRKRLR